MYIRFYKQCTTFSQYRHTIRRISMLQYVEGNEESELVVKKVNDTRWRARVDVTMAFSKSYNSFQKFLQVIAEEMTQKLQVIHEVKYFLKDLSKKENIIIARFWAVV
ncbi:TTF-type domain-containing protein [Trichonephila clavipes]|nr:TTF-type domain-containing protein [Trichonephila clavipes]